MPRSILKKTAVLISGKGSNLKALMEAARQPGYPAEITLVISNNPAAEGLHYAQAAGIPFLVLAHRDYPDREGFGQALHQALAEASIDLVCLAGFMRILSADFVRRWEGRLLNIHPSLLPEFKGLDTHARALAAGVTETGCTAHFVVSELDSGPVILQERVPVLPDDTPATLAGRVLTAEHRVYPEALRRVAETTPSP